jgi:hypothetical protein
VIEIPSRYDDILAISIPTRLTGFNKDLVLINVYDSPPQSSYKIKQRAAGNDVDTLAQLTDFVARLENKSVFLVGDFNARTGRFNSGGSILEVGQNFGSNLRKSYPTSLGSRASKDTILNERGSRMLEFLESCNLKILNGSTVGDILGEYTSLQYNGASVVDYMVVSPNIIDYIDNLKVSTITPYSDHSPLLCGLKPICLHMNTDSLAKKYKEAPQKLKWEPDSSCTIYQNEQETQEFRVRIDEILHKECSSAEDVIKLNENLSCVLRGAGERSGKKVSKRSKKRGICPKKKWFDISCIVKKRELNILSKKYGKNPTNPEIRENFYHKKKEYKSHIKKKKVPLLQRDK